jgi:hypothetical protein
VVVREDAREGLDIGWLKGAALFGHHAIERIAKQMQA